MKLRAFEEQFKIFRDCILSVKGIYNQVPRNIVDGGIDIVVIKCQMESLL